MASLLDDLVVQPLKHLEKGISINICDKEYVLVGTLVTIIGDHIAHVECLNITGVKSHYPSKFNLFPKDNTTTKITDTFNGSLQRTGAMTLEAIKKAQEKESSTKVIYDEDGTKQHVPRYVPNSTVIKDVLYEQAALVGMVCEACLFLLIDS